MLLLLCGLASSVVFIDQFTKYFVFIYRYRIRNSASPSGLIDLVYMQNKGIAFGLGKSLKHAGIIWIVLSLITVVFLLFFFLKYTRRRAMEAVAFGLITGGALGNLIDRMIGSRRVLDFIELGFIKWPAFNIADVAIVAGVIIMIFAVAFEFYEDAEEKKRQDTANVNGPQAG